jgi:hypothetical protein
MPVNRALFVTLLALRLELATGLNAWSDHTPVRQTAAFRFDDPPLTKPPSAVPMEKEPALSAPGPSGQTVPAVAKADARQVDFEGDSGACVWLDNPITSSAAERGAQPIRRIREPRSVQSDDTFGFELKSGSIGSRRTPYTAAADSVPSVGSDGGRYLLRTDFDGDAKVPSMHAPGWAYPILLLSSRPNLRACRSATLRWGRWNRLGLLCSKPARSASKWRAQAAASRTFPSRTQPLHRLLPREEAGTAVQAHPPPHAGRAPLHVC